MSNSIYELHAGEAKELTKSIVNLFVQQNPDPRVAITALMVMTAQVAMGMDITKDKAVEGFEETWDVIAGASKNEVMQ